VFRDRKLEFTLYTHADRKHLGASQEKSGAGTRGRTSRSDSVERSRLTLFSVRIRPTRGRSRVTEESSEHNEGMTMSAVDEPAELATTRRDQSDQSIAALIKQVSEESSRLLRGELRLAQAEMTEKAKTAGAGIGAFGAAAVLGWFALGCFLTTAILALALVLPAWLGALIVAVVVAIAAGIAALLGKKKVSEAAPPVPSNTVESVKKDVEEIKESTRR
jgi:hypothetical protein